MKTEVKIIKTKKCDKKRAKKKNYKKYYNYFKNPTCMNLAEDSLLGLICLEDYMECEGRSKCRFVPLDPHPIPANPPSFVEAMEVLDEIYNAPNIAMFKKQIESIDSKDIISVDKDNVSIKEVIASVEEEIASIEKAIASVKRKIALIKENDAFIKLFVRKNKIKSHGLSWHPLYKKWHYIMSICYNHRHPLYKNVGAKGIKVCKRWHNVENFVKDFSHYDPSKMTLRRKDKNKDFDPDNYVLLAIE